MLLYFYYMGYSNYKFGVTQELILAYYMNYRFDSINDELYYIVTRTVLKI